MRKHYDVDIPQRMLKQVRLLILCGIRTRQQIVDDMDRIDPEGRNPYAQAVAQWMELEILVRN